MVRVVARRSRSLAGIESAASPAHLGPAGGSDYALWLEELVRRFGAGAVGRWREPPEGWEFESWRARRRSEQNLFGLNARRGFPEDGNVRFNGCFQSHRSG